MHAKAEILSWDQYKKIVIEEKKEWVPSAACRDIPTAEFYAPGQDAERRVKQRCLPCPVREECLEFALALDDGYGVWGGTTEPERRNLRKKIKLLRHEDLRQSLRAVVRDFCRPLKEKTV